MSHIRNFHSIHCDHVLLQFLRMGIHIRVHSKYCKHQSSYHHHNRVHSQNLRRVHVRSCSSFCRNSHCLHSCCNSSNHIHQNYHSCRSRNRHHMMMMSHIHNLRSIHCDHVLLQFLRMGIHIRVHSK